MELFKIVNSVSDTWLVYTSFSHYGFQDKGLKNQAKLIAKVENTNAGSSVNPYPAKEIDNIKSNISWEWKKCQV